MKKRLTFSKDIGNGNKKIITRRHLLKSVALGAVSISFWPYLLRAATASENNGPREFRWRVPKVHSETVSNELRFEGEVLTEKDAKGVPLVFIYVGVVLIPYLAKAVLALRREIVYGGVIIDTRGKKIDIDTDKSLAGGVIIIVTSDGTQLYERDEIADPKELVSELMKGL